jgi:hypothetical protein
MKRIMVAMAVMLCIGFYASAQKTADIDFSNNMYDFGTVPSGTVATYEFKFSNNGRAPLIISDVKAQCTCTAVEWPKEPIEAGKSGVIKVTYDTQKIGMVVKKLTVTSNGRNPVKDIAVKINVVRSDVPAMPKDSSVVAPN